MHWTLSLILNSVKSSIRNNLSNHYPLKLLLSNFMFSGNFHEYFNGNQGHFSTDSQTGRISSQVPFLFGILFSVIQQQSLPNKHSLSYMHKDVQLKENTFLAQVLLNFYLSIFLECCCYCCCYFVCLFPNIVRTICFFYFSVPENIQNCVFTCIINKYNSIVSLKKCVSLTGKRSLERLRKE